MVNEQDHIEAAGGGTPHVRYRTVVDLSAEGSSHATQFRLIQSRLGDLGGDKPARVLEVGCASGYFSQALRDHGLWVYGIEPNPAAAAEAAGKLDDLYVGTIEQFIAEKRDLAGRFDFLIFGDVLEHLAEPAATLRQACQFLSPQGRVIASVPNVTHYSVRTMLMDGQWHYRRLGILDSTHLRFFSYVGLRKMLRQAGLAIEEMRPVTLSAEGADPFANWRLFRMAKPLMADGPHGEAYQFVFSARPAESGTGDQATGPRKVLCLLPRASWSVGDIRIVGPLGRYCDRFGGQIRVRQSCRLEDIKWADVLVVQRNPSLNVLAAMRLAFNVDMPVVYDIDDLLTEVPPFLQSHEALQAARGPIIACLGAADVVTTTTPRLKEQLLAHAETVCVIPNCADATEVDVAAKHSAAGPVTLLVASTDTVRVDMVIPALRRVAQTHGDRVRIAAIGPIAHELHRNGVPVMAHPIMSYAEFRGYLAGLTNAVGVIPLKDSLFSSCKSAIKYVDYAFAGIPAVCSAVSPYNDVVRDGAAGLLVPNVEADWFNALDRLVRSPQDRCRLATNAIACCRANYSLDSAAQRWNDLLSRLHLPDRELQLALGRRESAELRASYPIFPGWRRVGKALRAIHKPGTWRKAWGWLSGAARR